LKLTSLVIIQGWEEFVHLLYTSLKFKLRRGGKDKEEKRKKKQKEALGKSLLI